MSVIADHQSDTKQALSDLPRLSACNKIVYMVTGTAFLTALLIGGFFCFQISKIVMRAETDKLVAESRLISPYIMTAYNELYRDIQTLSKVPPIKGLPRSIQNGGIDPEDGSTTELWSSRLEEILSSLLEAKPSYVQARYIGIADDGKELVRADRKEGIISVTPKAALQKKGQEFYFKSALKYAPGEVYISSVTLNRENGTVQTPYLPVLRAIVPVGGSQESLYGMVAINVDYETMLRDALKLLDYDRSLYIINENGDYIHYDKRTEKTVFQYHETAQQAEDDDAIRSLIQSKEKDGVLHALIGDEEHVLHYRRLAFNPSDPSQFLVAAVSVPKAVMMAPAARAEKTAMALSVLLMLAASAAAAFFSFNHIRPIKAMIKEVRNFEQDGHRLKLPIYKRDEFGELAYAFDSLVTKLERAREAERQTLAKMKAIVDNTVDGLITINEHGTIESFNAACQEIFGYGAAEVIGKNVKILMPEPYRDEHDGYLRNYRDTGQKKIIGIGREVEGKRKDGSVFPIDLSVSEISVEGRKLYSGIVRDITERKKAEAEIIRSNEELERFAYVASHDLQEPLRMVSNFTKLLREEYGDQLQGEAAEYMDFIMAASARMRELVYDLLEYSRLNSGGGDYSYFCSKAQIDIVLDNLRESLDETGAVINIGAMPEINANPLRFSRLMQNLIGNALKYRSKDRVPEINIEAQEMEDEWVFCVGDNGIGIKEEYLKQIFIIFKRLHNKNDYSGTGIGLAVCKKITESVGGRIWAESEYGKGSSFYFTIPKNREEVRNAA